ncbi:MAG: hypothetical protein C0506_07510 [Anaerolinea sp.]|nr:hypothetical protein [Anaerolinea sp.]
MNTRDESNFDPRHIRECLRCGLKYDWRRSPSSSLKMTYCGSLCEQADLGFTIEALLHVERQPALAFLPVQPELELISVS